jgi:predicted small metal-binding protein
VADGWSDQETRSLRCACGWEATGTIEALIVAATDHGRRVHNMTPTRDDVLEMLLPLEPAHRTQPDGTPDSPA